MNKPTTKNVSDNDYPESLAAENLLCMRQMLHLALGGYMNTEGVAKFLQCSTNDVVRIAQENGITPKRVQHKLLPSVYLEFWEIDWFLDVKKQNELQKLILFRYIKSLFRYIKSLFRYKKN